MISLLFEDPVLLMLLIPVLMLSLTVHEVCHGYAALKCGDTTARDMGRLTLNPLAHLDITGALMMFIIGFGWAKPVPVNSRNFKNPRRDIGIVAIAGPLSNILMCFVSVLMYYICLAAFGLLGSFYALTEALPSSVSVLLLDQAYIFNEFLPSIGFDTVPALQCTLLQVFSLSAMINAGLAVFNLIPLPPLDGSKILAVLLPRKAAMKYLMLERYVRYVIIAICLINMVPSLGFISELVFMPITFLRKGLLDIFEMLMRLIFR